MRTAAIVLVMVQLLGGGPFRHGRLPGEHVIERAAQGINIAAAVGLARLQRLLRRDVVECAQGDA